MNLNHHQQEALYALTDGEIIQMVQTDALSLKWQIVNKRFGSTRHKAIQCKISLQKPRRCEMLLTILSNI